MIVRRSVVVRRGLVQLHEGRLVEARGWGLKGRRLIRLGVDGGGSVTIYLIFSGGDERTKRSTEAQSVYWNHHHLVSECSGGEGMAGVLDEGTLASITFVAFVQEKGEPALNLFVK